MKKQVTQLLLSGLICLMAMPVLAQSTDTLVTVREINSIPQNQIDQLNTLGTAVTGNDINDTGNALIFNQDLLGRDVRFTAVVISDPLNSGLANDDDSDGFPNRVHVFVRDTSAVTQGVEGMTVQLVDGNWQASGLGSLTVGDVIDVVGAFDPFFSTSQIAPSTVTLIGTISDLNIPETILDPVTVSTADLTVSTGDGVVLPNWDVLANFRNQYVRIEGAQIVDRDVSEDRPNWTISSDNGMTFLGFYDTSVRYRNDRSSDPSYANNGFNVRSDDFVPPPIGASVNVQAFLTFNNDDPFNRAGTDNGDNILLSFNPMSDADLEVAETPPVFASIQGPAAAPDGSEDVTIAFAVEIDPNRTFAAASCVYSTSADATEQTVDAVLNGDVYECAIPAQEDGVFTFYRTVASDNTGAISTSDTAQYKTLVDGIDDIEDIQLTSDEGFGSSPFTGFDALPMDIEATVQSDPSVSGFIVLQDNADLDGWSGIILFESGTALQQGDIVRITEADVSEFRDVTQLSNATYEVVSSGNDLLGYKVVTTDLLQDESIAEAHEGMMLQFDNVTVTAQNADSPDDDTGSNFGEWAISSDGTVENQLRVDDASDAIPGDPSSSDGVPQGFNYETITWGVYSFHRGVLSYSFGNYKLLPESPADIGEIVNVANEDDPLPNAFALQQNYPNPFNPTTSISYALPSSDHVTLEVFDLLGRVVDTLIDGVVNAGEHTIEFDAANLPSGIYLYRLSAGEKVTTKRMVLLK